MIANDIWIAEQHGMITPFVPDPVRYVDEAGNASENPFRSATMKRVVSYGLGHYGYDARLGFNFKVFRGTNIVDPKESWEDKDFTELRDHRDPVVIPPNSFVLAESLERFKIPRECLAIVLGKSTYARCGLVVNVTPLEPEWEGVVTIELSNTTPCPMRIYPGEGIMQVLFLLGVEYRLHNVQPAASEFNMGVGQACAKSYADKGGKYQDQTGMTDPKM